MKDKFIPLAKPYIDKEDIDAVSSAMKSGQLSCGPFLSKFELRFSSYLGIKYACAVSSGTAGLHMAVKAVGLKKGDEVITTSFSFIASSNCLLYEGIKPVFVDIDERTFNIDSKKIERAITKKTRAILVVHIFGQPADMESIMKIAKKHNLKVIEDACESIGAKYKESFSGTIGDVGVFGFYPNKQITTGEGGMIVTNSKKIYEDCCAYRNQGRKKNLSELKHDVLGYNYRMDEMSAALGFSQINKFNKILKKRKEIARIYNLELENIPYIILPVVLEKRTHSFFVYVIRITNGKRDFIQKKLTEKGIQSKKYLPEIHLQPFMKKIFKYKKGLLPITERVSSQTLALPLFYDLCEKNIKKITGIIKENI